MTKKAVKAAVEKKAANMDVLKVEYMPIDWLKPNIYNPNRQSEQEFSLLLKSITDDGMTDPVLCLPDGTIIDGEHRWKACKQLGFTEIPVFKADMDDTKRRIATLRHNLARGSHDPELEAGVLKDLQKLGQLDYAQEALQLSDIEIQRMINDVTPLDEFGAGTDFSQTWDYTAKDQLDNPNVSPSEAVKIAVDNQRDLQQVGMKGKDSELVNRGVTMTRHQEETYRKATGGNAADVIVAMTEAHVNAKERAGKGEWTTLTFVVPTGALLGIEQELDRLTNEAPNRNPDLTPELRRGLALEYAMVLSSQTPAESMQ